MCAKIVAVIRDRLNGDPVAGESVNFRTPGGTILDTEVTSADGSATYQANGNSAGLIKWDATVSGEQREASARAQRQIGAWFEAELAKSFQGIVSNGVSAGDGDECAVVPGSGRQVIVGTGCIWVLGVPFHFYDDTPLTAAANATGSTRLDRAVLRCDFNLANTTYGMGVLTYVTGTTSLPALNTDESGTYDYLLADISAANGYSSFTVGNITDQREIAGPSAHIHVMADITDLAAALALKAPLASPTFTGTATAATLNATSIGVNTATVGTLNATNLSFPAGAIDASDIGGGNVTDTEFDYLDGVTSSIQTQLNTLASADTATTSALALKAPLASPTLSNPTFTGTVTVPDGALAQADVSGLVAALAAKAALVDPTFTNNLTITQDLIVGDGAAISGNLSTSGGFHHTGGTWGFNGSSVSGKQSDPDDVSSGTVDATWGSPEALVLNDLRTSFNQLVVSLRAIGLITA